MKSWARHLVLGLLLAAVIPSAPLHAAQSAEQILLDKANYWRLKDRPDLAIEALQKLLSINPNQPDALYQYGILDVQQGKIDDAKGYLARLQKAAPASPRIADLENAIRAGQGSPSELTEARRLAQSGQFSQAAEKYQRTFKGAPPPTFGVEYYMTLAGTPQGWDEARRGLETLVQNSPNDSKAKLALAEVQTYHGETRSRGIRSLEQLVDDPVFCTAAEPHQRLLPRLRRLGADDRIEDQLLERANAARPRLAVIGLDLGQCQLCLAVVGRVLHQRFEPAARLVPALRRAGEGHVVFDAKGRRRRAFEGPLVFLRRLRELPALRQPP